MNTMNDPWLLVINAYESGRKAKMPNFWQLVPFLLVDQFGVEHFARRGIMFYPKNVFGATVVYKILYKEWFFKKDFHHNADIYIAFIRKH